MSKWLTMTEMVEDLEYARRKLRLWKNISLATFPVTFACLLVVVIFDRPEILAVTVFLALADLTFYFAVVNRKIGYYTAMADDLRRRIYA